MKVSAFIAASLDGYIAKENGDIEWLTKLSSLDDDFGYSDFIADIDVIVMGRKSFEKVISFDAWPYGDIRVFVLSKTLDIYSLGEKLPNKVEIFSDINTLLAFLKQNKYKDVYVDGGQTIMSFLKLGLLNEITLTHIPILLLGGIRLFGYDGNSIWLELLSSKVYSNGFVQSKYKVLA